MSSKHETERESLRVTQESLRARLLEITAKKIWGNDASLRVSVFGQWKGVLLRKVTEERNQLQAAVVSVREGGGRKMLPLSLRVFEYVCIS